MLRNCKEGRFLTARRILNSACKLIHILFCAINNYNIFFPIFTIISEPSARSTETGIAEFRKENFAP